MPDTGRLREWIQGAMPATLALLEEMVAINSWTGNPEGVNRLGRLTAERFAPLGFGASFVPSRNPAWGNHLFLHRPGRAALRLLLVSHLDTVFPAEEEERNNFHWQPEGERIFGPGVIDIKGGTAMAWLVLQGVQVLDRALFDEVDWLVALNASEETLSGHFGEVCREQLTPHTRAALVFEGEHRQDGVRQLVVARKGRLTFRLKVSGRAAHAGGQHARGANAIRQLARLVERVEAWSDPARGLTVNVGTIRGGGSYNRVPHAAEAEGEFRCFDPAVQEQTRQALLALAGPGDLRAASDGWACRVEVELPDRSPAWPRNPGSEALYRIWSETGTALGDRLAREERGGISDGNLLCAHVPTIDGLGPGGDNDHCSERSPDGSKLPEYLDVRSFVPKALLNVLAIAQLCRGGNLPAPRGS
ncbi:MAG: M20/M25/M40 family metallo-hydrolase [Verrucomicrobiales bacterium]|nr:M20/M25/M40 family metallo-hydrolase [Verrucomicrobiales bacterium]MCP5527138.1 M20/M25/M40 family metallo-hydrolase [Verrucomicrobiales bacterium]